MSPLDIMHNCPRWVHRPRLHPIRFHGVLDSQREVAQ